MDPSLFETTNGVQYYTYADYAKWNTTERYELIDGIPYMMASPSSAHQSIVFEIGHQLKNLLKDKKCVPFISPLDVCLNGKNEMDNTVFQPDVFVVCDRSKIEQNYINGAPDFVVEVLSPSSISRDTTQKMIKYIRVCSIIRF